MFQQRRDPPVPAIATPTLPHPPQLLPLPADIRAPPPPPEVPWCPTSEHEQQTQWIGSAGLPCPLPVHFPGCRSAAPPPALLSAFLCGDWGEHHVLWQALLPLEPSFNSLATARGLVTGSLAFHFSSRQESIHRAQSHSHLCCCSRGRQGTSTMVQPAPWATQPAALQSLP